MCAVSNTAVFFSSLTSCSPGMLLTYFPNDFGKVPVAHIITSISFVFTFHVRCISIVRSLYFKIFSASFLITFLSPEITTLIIIIIIIIINIIIIMMIIIIISFMQGIYTYISETNYVPREYIIIIIIIIIKLN